MPLHLGCRDAVGTTTSITGIEFELPMKKVATSSRTQSVTPRELLQNTIASDPEPKEKQKPQKMPKKGKEDVAEDVAEVTWFLRT